jgi:hypothetical protein
MLHPPASPSPTSLTFTHQPHLRTTGMRFFCTGDIGQITPAGNVQII